MSEVLSAITFHSPTQGEMALEEVIGEIKKFLISHPDAEFSLVIGSDSQEKSVPASRQVGGTGQKFAHVITAVIVHCKGFGGKYFWHRNKPVKIHSLREKIYAETFASLHFATDFVPILKKTLNGKLPKYNLEIHIDVGEHGATREMIKEVVGIIRGTGFVAKTKPNSYGASYIADRHT